MALDVARAEDKPALVAVLSQPLWALPPQEVCAGVC
jgi:hypothetical protein